MNAMNNTGKLQLAGTLSLISSFAGAGCTELTRIGVSGEHGIFTGHEEKPSLAAPRYFTTITGPQGAGLMPVGHLGDVDGDGLDDLLVGFGHASPAPGETPDMTVYLFYGRALLPPQLAPEDADATFETGVQENMPIGDVNGDGLADFALGDKTGYEIVFGSATRFSGHHAKFSTGIKWAYGEPSAPNGVTLRFFRAFALGDVNGDGADEFVLQASVSDPTQAAGWNLVHYLIEGRTSNWPSGAWDPSWAAARFGGDDPTQPSIYPTDCGDIDGDGYSDIIAGRDGQSWLYYGGPAGLHGTLMESNADAELAFGNAYPTIVGDADGDGADDILIASSGDIQLVYGSAARYAGVASPAPDLTFAGSSGAVLVGDYNADGFNDLIIKATPANAGTGWDEPPPLPVVYEMNGTGSRLTGKRSLQPEQLYRPVGYDAPEAMSGGLVGPIGDLDGDGSTELSVVHWGETGSDALYLLPGIGPEPD